jgi:hypothetical protein
MQGDATRRRGFRDIPDTQTGEAKGAAPGELSLLADARALLETAQRREVVDTARARAFAKACLKASPTGRLVLGVLDGGRSRHDG